MQLGEWHAALPAPRVRWRRSWWATAASRRSVIKHRGLPHAVALGLRLVPGAAVAVDIGATTALRDDGGVVLLARRVALL